MPMFGPRQLSVGEKQRITIGQILVRNVPQNLPA